MLRKFANTMKRILLTAAILAASMSPMLQPVAIAAPAVAAIHTDSPRAVVSQGSVTITAQQDCDAVFEIYSITGQLVKRFKLSAGTATIELHKGCYIVRCEGWSKKIVIN